MEREENPTAAAPLAEVLADPERRGSTVLVVGTVPHEAYARATRRLLGGDASSSPSRRLVVRSGAPDTAAERFVDTGPVEPMHARVIACDWGRADGPGSDADDRSAGNGRRAASAATPPVRTVDTSLLAIGRAVEETVAEFDRVANGLDPAEFRLGFDCLEALLDAHEPEQVFGYVHALTAQVRRARGVAHVGLLRSPDDELVRTFRPLFDAVVELRVTGQRLEHRWHLRDEGVTSEWTPVSDAVPRAD